MEQFDEYSISILSSEQKTYKNKVNFSGFSASVINEQEVNNVLDQVRRIVGPIAKLPYALRLVQEPTDNVVEYSDDATEFGAGDILMSVLVKEDIENALVVVACMPVGCFSTEFIAMQSIGYIRSCCMSAVERLKLQKQTDLGIMLAIEPSINTLASEGALAGSTAAAAAANAAGVAGCQQQQQLYHCYYRINRKWSYIIIILE